MTGLKKTQLEERRQLVTQSLCMHCRELNPKRLKLKSAQWSERGTRTQVRRVDHSATLSLVNDGRKCSGTICKRQMPISTKLKGAKLIKIKPIGGGSVFSASGVHYFLAHYPINTAEDVC